MLNKDPVGGPSTPVSQLPQLALENCELEGLACTSPSVEAGGLSAWTSGEGPRPWEGGCESRGPPTDLSLHVEKGRGWLRWHQRFYLQPELLSPLAFASSQLSMPLTRHPRYCPGENGLSQ